MINDFGLETKEPSFLSSPFALWLSYALAFLAIFTYAFLLPFIASLILSICGYSACNKRGNTLLCSHYKLIISTNIISTILVILGIIFGATALILSFGNDLEMLLELYYIDPEILLNEPAILFMFATALLISLWYAYRIIKGMYKLYNNKPAKQVYILSPSSSMDSRSQNNSINSGTDFLYDK